MSTTFRDTLHSIVHKHIQVAVESATREALEAYRSMLARELGGEARALPAASTAIARVTATKNAANGKRGPGFGAKMSALLKNRSCPVPGCNNKSRGPRYRFFCAQHADSLSQEEKERIIAESKGQAAAPAMATEAKRGKKGKRGRKAKA